MSKGKIKILPSSSGYDLAAWGYDKRENYLNSFEKGSVLPLLGEIKGKKILDVGAGTGRLSLPLFNEGALVTALDVSAEMLKLLKQKQPDIDIVTGEAEDMPFPDNTFDVVVCAFLIVHLKDPIVFFDEVYRVLKPGGKFLVTNINQKEPPEVKTKDGMIKIESYYHRPEKIRDLLNELSFTILDEKTIEESGVWINQIILAEK